MGNLEHVQALPAYEAANAGFAHCFQLIDVLDFEVSETVKVNVAACDAIF